MHVDIAYDGEQGLYLAEINPYDLMIFDIMLPKHEGVDMCRQLRSKKNKYSYLECSTCPGRCQGQVGAQGLTPVRMII